MPRERLSPLDASFLYLDGPVTCNQGVGYQIADGPIDFERLVEEMQRKVQYVDRLRQCAVFSPLNLFHPTWEFDPNFDIRNHVRRIVIEPAGDGLRYEEAIARIFCTKLDRGRPLWAVYVVDGRADGRSAHLVVIHHCVSDGVGFAKIAAAFFDVDRDLKLDAWTPPIERAWPSVATRVASGMADAIRAVPRDVSLVSRGLAALVSGIAQSKGRAAWRLLRRFRSAPGVRFAFNAPLSGDARFGSSIFRMQDIAAIRARHGGTINDVILAMVGAALHRYALTHGVETEGKFLRVLVPSNVRSIDTKDTLGNFVTTAPVLVPLGPMTTHDRLKQVVEFTREMKACGLARLMSLGIALSQLVLPAPLARVACRRYSSLRTQRRNAASKKAPSFNVVVTNVPGSPATTYAAGRELKEVSVLVPLLPSIGLCCGAISYNGEISITFSGDAETVPDVGILPGFVNEAFEELMRSES